MPAKTITLFHKSGTKCSHTDDIPEGDWNDLINQLANAFRLEQRQIQVLRLQNPYGLHKIDGISHFHIDDYDPPEPDKHMGLIPAS